MNRRVTNTIRFVMDELIPPFVRDSRVFMYPFYLFAYRGKNIREVMDFKTNVYRYTPEEYANFYRGLNTISRNRQTDLNQACIEFILDQISSSDAKILDVGCGGGFMLNKLAERFPNAQLTGFDIKEPEHHDKYEFVGGNVELLPFENDSFDVVISSHLVEHLIELEVCLNEMKRVAKKKLIVVTPCQRYFYYTLDEHVNFFPFEGSLTSKIGLTNFKCEKLNGDWAYIGFKDFPQ